MSGVVGFNENMVVMKMLVVLLLLMVAMVIDHESYGEDLEGTSIVDLLMIDSSCGQCRSQL
jgi:hypothetical protein